ncbi:hypothetical protein [Sutcliffiella horikoshii]|uniref:hypothetical protein n=1 Tax=Sutcliffiella horikoshii TaxID=79883 RepID=UPI001F17A489|nr:hypothetical protein [Sutcliffiella horikoshii]MCG1020281.1 hypothetical protein [Sutcliffiella horikoshii]
METNVFKGLMRKEWLLLRNSFIFLLCTMFFVWFAGLGWSVFTGNATILLIISIMFIIAHVLYVTWIVGAGLHMEEKSQLWLHNPHSTSKLLGSKLVTAIYLQSVSILFALLLLTLTVNVAAADMIGKFEMESLTINSVVSVLVQVMVSGLELGMYYMFFWIIYHVMGQFHYILKFRVVLFILFIVLLFMLVGYVESHLWTVLERVVSPQLEMAKFMNFYIEEGGVGVRSSAENITIAGIIVTLLKVIGLFSLSSWLLNKVVEVR